MIDLADMHKTNFKTHGDNTIWAYECISL